MKRSLALLTVFACLTGCATNAIRLDRAETMTASGRAATSATRDLMKEVRSENRASLLDLVAADPACRLPHPTIAQGQAEPGTTLCRRGDRGSGDFDVKRFVSRDFEASLAVIEGLTAYLDVVDAIVTREPLDLAGTVIDTHDQLDSIAKDLGTLGGPTTPSLTDDQKTAVQSTLSLLSEIIDEAQRVDDLREIEIREDPAKFNQSLTSLGAANDQWLTTLEAQIDTRRSLAERRLSRMTEAGPRRQVADELLTLIERQEELPQLARALKGTVAALQTAHVSYRELLIGGGKLSAKERVKAADLTRARLRATLRNLAALVKAF